MGSVIVFVKFFHRRSESIQCYTHVGVRAKLNQLFITRRKNFINLYNLFVNNLLFNPNSLDNKGSCWIFIVQ